MGRIVPLQCPEGPRLTHLQDFSDRFMALDFRWDEKADPRAVPCAAWVCKRMRAPCGLKMEGGSAHDGW